MRKFITLLCVTGFLISCGGSKKVISTRTERTVPRRTTVTKVERTTKEVTITESSREEKKPVPVSYKDKVKQYIFEFSGIAKDEMKTYGIPASITLAQGILESGAGHGELTQKAKNHFGIKCHDWKGDQVYHDDDRSQECFRKYDNASDSFRDHSLFLKDRKRYSKLFTFNQKDYKSWARGLREAGYATDKKYPQKLISIIERYHLYEYDNDVLGRKNRRRENKAEPVIVMKPAPKPVATPVSNPSGGHIVRKGDTLYSISRRYKVSVEELKTYNNLLNNNIKIGQVLKLTTEEEEEDFN